MLTRKTGTSAPKFFIDQSSLRKSSTYDMLPIQENPVLSRYTTATKKMEKTLMPFLCSWKSDNLHSKTTLFCFRCVPTWVTQFQIIRHYNNKKWVSFLWRLCYFYNRNYTKQWKRSELKSSQPIILVLLPQLTLPFVYFYKLLEGIKMLSNSYLRNVVITVRHKVNLWEMLQMWWKCCVWIDRYRDIISLFGPFLLLSFSWYKKINRPDAHKQWASVVEFSREPTKHMCR